MLLAIDIGNTNIHLGLWRDNSWRLSWRARTIADKMADEYAVLVRNFLSSAELHYKSVSGVVISCVVPPLTPTWIELVRRYLQLEPIVVTSDIQTGIRIAIDQPSQAGADRIVNAVAAKTLYGCPAIVIDFGTSTNFDVVSPEGDYIGGALAPGLMVTHDALVSRAAKLYKVDLVPPPDPIGRNTTHAMQSGIFWGYVGMIDGLIKRLKASLASDTIHIIGTGGLAPRIAEYIPEIGIIAPELTLDGLRIIYELNR